MVEVIMYSTQVCPYCQRAKDLLADKGVTDITEVKIDEQPDKRQEMLAKSGGRKTVPQIFIGDHHVGGFDDLYALNQQGGLDPLLAGK